LKTDNLRSQSADMRELLTDPNNYFVFFPNTTKLVQFDTLGKIKKGKLLIQ